MTYRGHDPNRQTGRTTRLLKQALTTAAEGKQVAFVCHNAQFFWYVRNLANDLLQESGAKQGMDSRYTLRFENGGQLRLVSANDEEGFRFGFDFDEVVWDHTAQERRTY